MWHYNFVLTANNELQSFTRTKVLPNTEPSAEADVVTCSYGRKSVGLVVDENSSSIMDLMFAINQFIALLKV